MPSLTRREVLGAMASTPLLAATGKAEIPAEVIRRHDEAVDNCLRLQITDPASRGYGSLREPRGIYSGHGASGLMAIYMAAFLQPRSKFHKNNLLVDRMKLGAHYLTHSQHEDGFIDYLETNFDSPPDTAFGVIDVATAACLAKRHNEPELLAIPEPFLRKAGAGLAVGGIHTPNHRWVVSASLAQINEVFPNPAYLHRIDQWLAEGIDIDADGQFTERSTSVYNSICDRAFVVLAAKLNRPALLDPVRRNLNSMMYLVHPDGEVVTEISHRQDRDQHGTMARYWFPLQYMGVHDQNGQFATLAQQLAPVSASLPAFMEYPELVGSLPPGQALPSDYLKEMNSLGVVRIRRGPTSATILEDNPNFFMIRRGAAVIQGIRFASSFFGKGQFAGTKIERDGNSFVLKQELAASYYQPLEPSQPVNAQNWMRLREQRRKTQTCRLEQIASITEIESGFRLRVQTHGTTNVPVAVEIALRDGGRLDGCEKLETGSLLPTGGHAVYTAEGGTLRIGPGKADHKYIQLRGALPRMGDNSIYLTGFAPFDHTVDFHCT